MYDARRAEPPTWVTRSPAVAGILVALVAGVVLVGWFRDFRLLHDYAPLLPQMKANTALGCLAAGLSLLGGAAVGTRWRFFAVVPAGIGGATLVEWLAGVSLGIDEALVDDPFAAADPGRPSPQLAVALLFFGIARVTAPSPRERLSLTGAGATVVFAVIVLFLELGFLFGAPELTSADRGESVAVPCAVAVGLLVAGLLATHAHRRPISYLWHPGVTGALTRRLLPAVVLAPPILGLVRLFGQHQGWYGLGFGVAIYTGSMIVVLAVVVTVTAHNVDRTEQEAAAASAALRRAEQKARYLADHDPLTQAWNRRHFERDLTEALASPQSAGALMIVDVDHFKTVNDTLGHHAGDQLLCSVADELAACVGGWGSVSRIGGDEFAVLLREGTADDVERIAGEIVTTLDGIGPEVSASVGVALLGDLDPDDRTRHAVLSRADEALYDAKRAGRGRHVVHTPIARSA